ncbi:hypothetical protein SGCZBJ_24765 [Caulobacter zeae]|uniref:Glycosyltransferase family 17 n=1 Tax=Caulobacter zeae TaxID=2055137 RepID=A0A2N5CYH3_9CAUL|nr:hypothetical protein SGCZBJ_24765 [Caulobacter zeae]
MAGVQDRRPAREAAVVIIDACTFYNEFGLLKLRMATLAHVVDRFVVVEMGVTHSGVRKGFVLEDYLDQLPVPRERICYVKLCDWPRVNPRHEADRWVLENFQRNAITRGLDMIGAGKDDTVIISDVDEIPDPAAIPVAVAALRSKPFAVLVQVYRKHFINGLPHAYVNSPLWLGSVLCRVGQLDTLDATACRRGDGDRAAFLWTDGAMRADTAYITRGGWHLTYMGGVDAVRLKLESIVEGLEAHQPKAFFVPQRSRHNFRDGRTPQVERWVAETDIGIVPRRPLSTPELRYLPEPVLTDPTEWEWLWWYAQTID